MIIAITTTGSFVHNVLDGPSATHMECSLGHGSWACCSLPVPQRSPHWWEHGSQYSAAKRKHTTRVLIHTVRVCWVKRTVAKSNVWLQKAQMCTFHTTHNHSNIEEQIKECFTTGMLCMELVTTTTPHPSHHSLRKSLLLTLNWCWKPVSVQSGGVLSSLFTLILMLGARILVSPHTMSSWMASWIKIYWSYKREGINTLMIS